MKKTQNFVMRQVIDEYVMVPRGETAERINGPMTLSETAAFIYDHLEEVKTPEKMAHLLFKLLRQADDDHIPVLFSEVLTTDGIGLAIMNRLSRAAAFTEIDADVEEEE